MAGTRDICPKRNDTRITADLLTALDGTAATDERTRKLHNKRES